MCDHTTCEARPRKQLCESYDVQCTPVLGNGPYATVVKAFHRQENVFYALKIFSGEKLRKVMKVARMCGSLLPTMPESAMEAHLTRELEILQGLQHPCVCALKEAFIDQHSISIVLELGQGGNLMSYTRNREVLLEPEGQYFAYQICDALEYIHSQGIAHWDLKPENVLLTSDIPPMVLLADCGVTKVIDYLSELQTRCGPSLPFTKPEVLSDSIQQFDKSADSWSLGFMMFRLLCKSDDVFEEGSDEPHWYLLEDYNISETGMNFIGLLLGQNPGARMTPAQALLHPWIKAEGARQRARSQEQDQTLSRDDVRRPSSPETDISTGDSQSKKRKFSFLHPEESLATVSVGGDTYEAGAKRTRFEQPTVQCEPAHLADFGDEIPGLGLYCG